MAHGVVQLDVFQCALVHGGLLVQDRILIAGYKEVHAGDGAVIVDGVAQLQKVVLALGVVELC